MRFKQILLTTLILTSVLAMSQEKAPKFLQFNNFSASFEVPAGKTWVIENIFSNSVGELITNPDGTTSTLPIRIFIKTLNGDIKTDYEGNRFGPQVYQSDNMAATISYPITLPEGTKFSLVIVIGNPGACKSYSGSGYLSFFEISNNTF